MSEAALQVASRKAERQKGFCDYCSLWATPPSRLWLGVVAESQTGSCAVRDGNVNLYANQAFLPAG